MRVHPRRTARGSASIGVVLTLAALQLVVVGVVLGGARDQDLSSKRLDALRAQYAAEAGANMAAREFAQNADEDGDGTMGTISAKTALTRATFSVSKAVAGSTSTFTVSASSGDAARRAQLVGVETAAATGLSPGVKTEGWALTPAPTGLSSVPFGTTPDVVGWTYQVNMPNTVGTAFWAAGPSNKFGMRLSATLTIPTTGSWTFTLGSDDGSDLTIDGSLVVNHDGIHSFSSLSGTVALSAGTHTLVVRYVEKTGNNGLTLSWSGPGVASTTVIPASAFSANLTGIPAVAATTTVSIGGDATASASTVDGFNSSSGVYGGANIDTTNTVVGLNSTSGGAFAMSGLARLQGSGRIGVGGTPSSVFSLSGGATISGTQTAATSGVAIMGRVGVPTMPATSGSVSYTSGTTTLSANQRFNNLTLSGASTVLNVSGHISIQVDGTLSLAGNAQVNILSGSSLTIYANGATTMTGTSGINANTGDPAKCRLFIFSTAASNLSLSSSAVLCAQVAGSNAELVLDGTGATPAQLIGTYGGERITLTNRGRIHADLAGRTGSGGSGTRTVKFTSWAMVP